MDMPSVSLLVLEDDALFRVELERILEELDIRPVFHKNADKALELLESGAEFDLALVDIKLQGDTDGIDFGKYLKNRSIPFIFQTVYDDPLVYERAQQLKPYGYLVKPFSKFTLKGAIEGALLYSGERQKVGESSTVSRNPSFFVKSKNTLIKLDMASIKYIQAQGNYSTIVSEEKTSAAKMSLKELKLRLPSHLFVQVHRSFVVNLNFIQSYNQTDSTLLIEGEEIPVGNRYREDLFDRISKF